MAQMPQWIVSQAKFKTWILGKQGETTVKYSLPYRSEITALNKLKGMILEWRSFQVHLAIFYDRDRRDDEGSFLEIGRYENGRFHGL